MHLLVYGDEVIDREWAEVLRQTVEAGDNLFSASTVLIPAIVKVQEVLLNALRMQTNLLNWHGCGCMRQTLP